MNDTECFKELIEYEANETTGELGSLMEKPSCDGDGYFSPIKCISGSMYIFYSSLFLYFFSIIFI